MPIDTIKAPNVNGILNYASRTGG